MHLSAGDYRKLLDIDDAARVAPDRAAMFNAVSETLRQPLRGSEDTAAINGAVAHGG
jgi:hypothetical protein